MGCSITFGKIIRAGRSLAVVFLLGTTIALAAVKPTDVKVGDIIVWLHGKTVYAAKVQQISQDHKYFGIMLWEDGALRGIMFWVDSTTLKNLDIAAPPPKEK
jgi:hypothetical protein